jgi:hypothetical protein
MTSGWNNYVVISRQAETDSRVLQERDDSITFTPRIPEQVS